MDSLPTGYRHTDDGGARGMVDPISLGAIGAVLAAVGSGMANEAGKRAWESAGGLVRRIAGR
jgi:hypothetical protein